MLNSKSIVGLCTVFALSALVACGQKGVLVLPNEAAAQNRATLPQVLSPASAASSPASSPAPLPSSSPPLSPASAPKR